MAAKLFLVILAIVATTNRINAIVVDSELKLMNEDVRNQTVEVTSYAANENPNTLTEQRETATILKHYVEQFDLAYDEDLKNLVAIMETARQNADIGSPSALCYKLQLTKVEPARAKGVERKKEIDEQVDEKVNDLVESTKKLIDDTKLDLDVKTIVQLCMKIYTGIGQDKERLQCFDEYGAHLSIGQKSKGEGLLERVGTIQQQTLRISDKTDESLRGMFANNQLDYTNLNQEQVKCANLPGSNTTPAPTSPTTAPTTAPSTAPTTTPKPTEATTTPKPAGK